MRPTPLTTQRLVALFGLGWLLFDAPLARLWSSAVMPFVLWAAVIGALAWLMERGDD